MIFTIRSRSMTRPLQQLLLLPRRPPRAHRFFLFRIPSAIQSPIYAAKVLRRLAFAQTSRVCSADHLHGVCHGMCSDIGTLDLRRRFRVLGRLEQGSLVVVKVLSWINSLVLHHLHNSVHSKSQKRAHERTKPVYVMISWPVSCDYARSETSGRIQASAGKEHANHFSYKERKANADWCQVCCFVLLGSEHEDREDEKCGKKHLEKNTLCDRSSGSQGGSYIERARKDGGDNPG